MLAIRSVNEGRGDREAQVPFTPDAPFPELVRAHF